MSQLVTTVRFVVAEGAHAMSTGPIVQLLVCQVCPQDPQPEQAIAKPNALSQQSQPHCAGSE